MTRILFVTPHAGGNVPPTLEVAGELVAGGHDVRVLGHPRLEEQFVARGVEFRPFRRARPWTPVVERPGLLSMLRWLRLASDRGIAADVRDELERQPADVVVVDCMVPVALRPARRSGAGVALLLHAFSGYWVSQWSATGPVGAWLRLTGTHPSRYPADAGILLTAPELDPVDGRRIPAREVHQTGPVVPVVPVVTDGHAVDAGAPVLVSFSTISYPGQREALQRTLDAIGALRVSAIATVAPSLEPDTLRVPDHVEVRGLVPHTEVLPTVRLLVGHGGHGTTMAALAHGIPVLVIAMSSLADQPLVGRAVERAGVGLSLRREASVAEVGTALRTLLADPAPSERAAELGARWRDGAPVRAAAAAIASTTASE